MVPSKLFLEWVNYFQLNPKDYAVASDGEEMITEFYVEPKDFNYHRSLFEGGKRRNISAVR